MSCCSNCGNANLHHPVKKGCCKTTEIDPSYVPVYEPACCPDSRNRDPRRKEFYRPPTLCRSEPLSHAEYLRKLKANNTVALSSPASKVVTQGDGVYKRTVWTSAGDACSLDSDLVLPAVSPVLGGGHARDAWQYTEMKGAYAGRGTVSKFDSVNRTEDITRLRRQGLAIAADESFMAPARGKRVICEVCTLVGTTDVDPGSCGICGPESTIVSPVRAGSIYFDGNGWLQDPNPTVRTSLAQGLSGFTTEFFVKSPTRPDGGYVSWGTLGTRLYNGIKQDGRTVIAQYFIGTQTSTNYSSLDDGKWHHVAVQWDTATVLIYVDGILKQTGTPLSPPNVTGFNLHIGRNRTATGIDTSAFSGYLSNVRVTNHALYSGTDTQFPNFDVTSGPFSATQAATNNVNALTGGQTAALLNMNYHHPTADSSTYGIDMDISGGSLRSSRENPFSGPGSLFFNASANVHLKVDNDVDFRMRTGDFTIEWFQRIGSSANGFPRIFSIGSYPNTSIGVSIEDTSHIFIYWSNTTQVVVGNCNPTLNANGWTHFAISRSGTTTRFFENGSQLGADYYDPHDYNDRGNSLFIGNQDVNSGIDAPFFGYITNFRWTKGTALYTSGFTVPSVPLAVEPNTKLLLLAQTNDTAITDSSGLDKVVVLNGVTWANSTPA
jgi:Concanavalin A-like lectin/glucanases superfamily